MGHLDGFIQEKIATKEAELVNYEQSIESVREKIKVKVAEVQDQNSRLQVKFRQHCILLYFNKNNKILSYLCVLFVLSLHDQNESPFASVQVTGIGYLGSGSTV